MALLVDIEKQAGDFCLKTSFTCGTEFLGILGASGCGKSMTLKCIAGIEKPDRGQIVLDGKVLFDSEAGIDLPPQKRHVGYLFQNYALFPNMTVRQNILCGVQHEKNPALRQAKADEMISLLQLEDIRDLRPHQISGGQAQRAALGRILVNQPRLLMLDEPFSALDTFLRLKLQMELRDILRSYERGILMVTHDRDEAFRMCDKIGVMQKGEMLTVKGTKELFANPGTRAGAVLTGCKNIVTARKTGEREVFVPSWNLHLQTREVVGDDLCAIGIRAHYFHPGATRNAFPVKILREMEEPFEWVTEFQYEGQEESSPGVWWRYSKEKRPAKMPDVLGVSPANILLLYEEPHAAFHPGREG